MDYNRQNHGVCNCCQKKVSSVMVSFNKHFKEGKCPNWLNMMKYGVANPSQEQIAAVAVNSFEDVYLLKVNMDRLVKTWWMLIAVPVSLTLGQLDRFFRGVWMECGCGHLSSFRYYGSDDLKFDRKLIDLRYWKRKVEYAYDFGSTEHVVIERVGIMKKCIKPNFAVVLSRNNLPAGYSYSVNSPRAMEGHGLVSEVKEMKVCFELPPNSGDKSSQKFAAEEAFHCDAEEEEDDEYGSWMKAAHKRVWSRWEDDPAESSFLTEDNDETTEPYSESFIFVPNKKARTQEYY